MKREHAISDLSDLGDLSDSSVDAAQGHAKGHGKSDAKGDGAERQPHVLPRYRREQSLVPPFALQERDMSLLDDLCRFRLLTTSQIELLRRSDPNAARRFPSRLTLTRRLKLLFHHGYVARVARPLAAGSLEPVYLLDKEGAKALRKRRGDLAENGLSASLIRAPSQRPKAAALEHLLAINQFRVCLTVACRDIACRDIACRASGHPASGRVRESGENEKIQLLNWKGPGEVKFSVAVLQKGERAQGERAQAERAQAERAQAERAQAERARHVTLIPDGFFLLRGKGQRLFFFLEVDLGTEPSRTLAEKCRAYYDYWQSGGFARDFDVPQSVGFRALFVAPTARREATIQSAIRQLPVGRAMFWTALQESVTPQHLLQAIFRSGANQGGANQTVAGVERIGLV